MVYRTQKLYNRDQSAVTISMHKMNRSGEIAGSLWALILIGKRSEAPAGHYTILVTC